MSSCEIIVSCGKTFACLTYPYTATQVKLRAPTDHLALFCRNEGLPFFPRHGSWLRWTGHGNEKHGVLGSMSSDPRAYAPRAEKQPTKRIDKEKERRDPCMNSRGSAPADVGGEPPDGRRSQGATSRNFVAGRRRDRGFGAERGGGRRGGRGRRG